jgi:uncharacterized protein
MWCLMYFLPPWTWVLGLATYVAFVRWLEHRRCTELRGGWAAGREFVLGVAVGGTEIAAPYLVLVAMGYQGRLMDLGGVAPLVATAAFGPLCEEPLVRGLVLRYLELAFGSWWALIASSVGYALAHFAFGPLNALQFVGIALGMLSFGAAYLWTRRLWLSLGLHISYNVILAVLSSGTIRVHGFQKPVYWIVGVAIEAAVAASLIFLASRAGSMVGPKKAWRAQTTGNRFASSPPQTD